MNVNKIDAQAKSVSDLLGNKKYAIDYYQREYKWETKQITELLEDLEDKFLDNYEEGHSRIKVERYKHYFLGSIIVSNRDGKKFIIDGQQRLTSLTLLLIYLNNLQRDHTEQVDVSNLIFSEKFGKKSFNIDVDERVECLEALYNNQTFNANGGPESVHNIAARYDDIEDNFPEVLKKDALLYFIDWLKENVDLVKITTHSDNVAPTTSHTRTMRPPSPGPTDMLKGYLLANIGSAEERAKANDLWKNCLLELLKLGKEEDADFFKAWLRAKYAQSIREHRKGATNIDFDIIGTTFHKCFTAHCKPTGRTYTADFREFVMIHFKSFSGVNSD